MMALKLLGSSSAGVKCAFSEAPFMCSNPADLELGEGRPSVCAACLSEIMEVALDPKAREFLIAGLAVCSDGHASAKKPAPAAPLDEDEAPPVGEEGDEEEREEDEASVYAAAIAELEEGPSIAPPPSAGRRAELHAFREKVAKGEAKPARLCEAEGCNKPLPEGWPAIYCSTACALGDA